MKVGIAIDNWKLSIFKLHLSRAGYRYEISRGVTAGTSLIKATTDDTAALELVVRAANAEAALISKGGSNA